MNESERESATGVLNETSMTIHKRAAGTEGFRTSCGQSYHLDSTQLRKIRISEATEKRAAEKCGRCFGDGRGY